MKTKSLEKNLINLLIFSVIVLIILYCYHVKEMSKENFSDIITIKDNFYDITSGSGSGSPALKTGDDRMGNKIGGTNLCIYESNGNRVTDIECISSGEFNNALELPKARRETVCIDEECIDLGDLKFLLGDTYFQIKTGSDRPTQDNYKDANCLGKKYTSVWSCREQGGPYKYEPNLVAYLGKKKCYNNGGEDESYTTFKLNQRLGMSYSDLQRYGTNQPGDLHYGNEDYNLMMEISHE